MKLFTAMESYNTFETFLSMEELTDNIDTELTDIGNLSHDYIYAYEAYEQLVKLNNTEVTGTRVRDLTMECIALQLGYGRSAALEKDGIGSKIADFGRRVWAKIVAAWNKVKNWVLGLFGKGKGLVDKAKKKDAEEQASVKKALALNKPRPKTMMNSIVKKPFPTNGIDKLYVESELKGIEQDKGAEWSGISYNAKKDVTGFEIEMKEGDQFEEQTTLVDFVIRTEKYSEVLERVVKYQDAIIKLNDGKEAIKEDGTKKKLRKNSVEIVEYITKDIKTWSNLIKKAHELVDSFDKKKD